MIILIIHIFKQIKIFINIIGSYYFIYQKNTPKIFFLIVSILVFQNFEIL
jgi:hypothetical protein